MTASLSLFVFWSGAVLMALEILGSRVLAPDFGSSIFVWGSLIAVFLSALSLGYAWGGWLADRRPDFGLLAGVVASAGALMLAIPALADPVAAATKGLGPRGGPLLAAFLVFFAPSVLLGFVSPFATRLAARQVESVGRVAGRLSAVSTAGSILGTIGTAFWLVPLAGTRSLILGLGLSLILLAGLVWWRLGRKRAGVSALAAALALATLLAGWRPTAGLTGLGGARVIYRLETLYHNLRVEEDATSRFLRFNNAYQGGIYLGDLERARFLYSDFFQIGMTLGPEAPESVLFIGLGAGIGPRDFLRLYPNTRIDVVEIDPAVVAVAREYFFLPDDERLRVIVADGRRYLEETDRQYDAIILDAYYADAIPFQLTTAEFFRLAARRLKPDGVLVANFIGALEGRRSQLFRSIWKTAGMAFSARYAFTVPLSGERGVNLDPERRRNITFVGGGGAQLSPYQVRQRIVAGLLRIGRSDLERYAEQLYDRPIEVADVPLLTDDRAPVDQLLYVGD